MPTLKIYDSATQTWEAVGTGVGLATYDMTHTSPGSESGSGYTEGYITVTFPANKRCTQLIQGLNDIQLDIICNNSSDNYIWVSNKSDSSIDVDINSVTYNGNQLSYIFLAIDTTVEPGSTMEIGIVCNANGAFITSRNDLTLV